MFYELNPTGAYVSDIVELPVPNEGVPDVATYPDWTAEPFPWGPYDAVYQRVFTGTRNSATGEWTGTWSDAGPAPIPATAKPSYYESQTASYYDTEAQGFGYANHRSLLARAGYTGDAQALAQAFGAWVDACNKICGAATNGVAPEDWPPVEDLIASFPAFAVPSNTPAPTLPAWYI